VTQIYHFIDLGRAPSMFRFLPKPCVTNYYMNKSSKHLKNNGTLA